MTIKAGIGKLEILFLHECGLKLKCLLNLASSVSWIVFYTTRTLETWQVLINFSLYLPALCWSSVLHLFKWLQRWDIISYIGLYDSMCVCWTYRLTFLNSGLCTISQMCVWHSCACSLTLFPFPFMAGGLELFADLLQRFPNNIYTLNTWDCKG
jgi:hypothetical protein